MLLCNSRADSFANYQITIANQRQFLFSLISLGSNRPSCPPCWPNRSEPMGNNFAANAMRLQFDYYFYCSSRLLEPGGTSYLSPSAKYNIVFPASLLFVCCWTGVDCFWFFHSASFTAKLWTARRGNENWPRKCGKWFCPRHEIMPRNGKRILCYHLPRICREHESCCRVEYRKSLSCPKIHCDALKRSWTLGRSCLQSFEGGKWDRKSVGIL